MGAEVTYELNLEPAEDAVGWTAMVYRYVKAGVCGPWTETKPIPGLEGRMFVPVNELAAKALAVLGLQHEFEAGEAEVYGRFGKIGLRVDLTHAPAPVWR
jgi:hypothetical protein